MCSLVIFCTVSLTIFILLICVEKMNEIEKIYCRKKGKNRLTNDYKLGYHSF